MPKGVTFEKNILEIVVDQFRRRIVVTLDLVADHLHLLIYLRLRISAVENNIRQHVHSLRQVLFQDSRIIDRVLLLRKGIQVAAHALQCVQYLQGTAARRSLEGDVLHEMRQSLLPRFLIPCSCSYLITTIHHRRSRRQMNHAQSVRQSISIVLHKFANLLAKLLNFLTSGKTNANYLQTTLFLQFSRILPSRLHLPATH